MRFSSGTIDMTVCRYSRVISLIVSPVDNMSFKKSTNDVIVVRAQGDWCSSEPQAFSGSLHGDNEINIMTSWECSSKAQCG